MICELARTPIWPVGPSAPVRRDLSDKGEQARTTAFDTGAISLAMRDVLRVEEQLDERRGAPTHRLRTDKNAAVDISLLAPRESVKPSDG